MDLVKQQHWDKKYQHTKSIAQGANRYIMEWLHRWMPHPNGKGLTCFEVGVFPGGYINEFGKLGYTISGIDLTPRVGELNDLFRSRNYSVGKFWWQDFFELTPDQQYDFVYSVGFIEHFMDYKSVIAKHCDLVAKGGLLFIVVPNFKGKLQQTLHRILDNPNLKRHNLASMNPKEWEEVLLDHHFEIIRQGYIGKFYFWAGIKTKYVRHFVRLAFNYIINPVLSTFLSKPSPSYSPFCAILAQKSSL